VGEEPLATTTDLTHYYFTEKLINMSTRYAKQSLIFTTDQWFGTM